MKLSEKVQNDINKIKQRLTIIDIEKKVLEREILLIMGMKDDLEEYLADEANNK